jgi:hypothetical protein
MGKLSFLKFKGALNCRLFLTFKGHSNVVFFMSHTIAAATAAVTFALSTGT